MTMSLHADASMVYPRSGRDVRYILISGRTLRFSVGQGISPHGTMSSSTQPAILALSDGVVTQLTHALAGTTEGSGVEVEQALAALATEARARRLPPESIVPPLKAAWQQVALPRGVTDDEWSRAYLAAIGRCLTTYFDAKA